MPEPVSFFVDGQPVTAAAGTIVVDAAKTVGNDIPVFCYHPKLDPVGMCRMCLVEIGMPQRDRATGAAVLDEDGQPKIAWLPKLQTACTTPVAAGMHVRTTTAAVERARKDVVELILTSHPLDCPVCDKGGECPLQNLTMRHGPGSSRFVFDEKIKLEKHVPLGDLIYLDRERCIQCARCTRFQEDIAGDPVIGFDQRGRSLQIVTHSDPGFDSYFSGNTTDICPVGALTTADFRFGARPWELKHSDSICTHCPVGCNLHLNTRRSGVAGDFVIKRVMPRQNELVNETWICDKGRFGQHFATSLDRLTVPLVRRGGQLVEATWDEALAVVAARVQAAPGAVAALAGERLSNEDLFALRRLMEGTGGRVAQWPGAMGGGDVVQQVGVGMGTDIARAGGDTVIVLVATDLEEEAPVWWLRVRQAATKAGATLDKSRAQLIVLNGRSTTADSCATHVVRYVYGEEARSVTALTELAAQVRAGKALPAGVAAASAGAAQALAAAKNIIVFYGRDGLGYAGSAAVAQACANLLIATGNGGRHNSGLVPVWPHSNTQGAWDMGVRPSGLGAAEFAADAAVVIAAGADPLGDGEQLPGSTFVVAVELFATLTAQRADVVLPARAFTEREGTLTSGERRVQRYYPALPVRGQARADWQIFFQIGEALGLGKSPASAAAVMLDISRSVAHYSAINYQALAKVEAQWPDVGGSDLYYGGTSFQNNGGLGAQTPTLIERGQAVAAVAVADSSAPQGELQAVPIAVLYDRSTTFGRSAVMGSHIPAAYVELNAADAARMQVANGARVRVRVQGRVAELTARVNGRAPLGVVLVPQSLGGLVLHSAQPATVERA